jgi:UDP-N-acetyl-D-mannosaminuronic acid dehydrogenase
MDVTGFDLDVAIVGGCGRVGLPLGIAFAESGARVVLYDVNEKAVGSVSAGTMPFAEPGTQEALLRVLEGGQLCATTEAESLSRAEAVVVVVGTPVDDHLNPDLFAVLDAVRWLEPKLVNGQLLVLRSTVYPGVTAMVNGLLADLGRDIDVCFCPERIAEGKALAELRSLPQIVSGISDKGCKRATDLFSRIADETVRLDPTEAELAKLFTNSWRYIKFAVANQFFMIANDYGIDFEAVRAAIRYNYPRASDLPGAGFAAGPCLLKDTMQLAAFNNNGFTLGHASMMINEGLPLYVVSTLARRLDLSTMTVGILGMAFKGESDDRRDSLSYKLKRLLRFRAKAVLCTDPYVRDDPELVPLEQVIAGSDLLIVGTPHEAYASLNPEQETVDVWNLFGRGVTV